MFSSAQTMHANNWSRRGQVLGQLYLKVNCVHYNHVTTMEVVCGCLVGSHMYVRFHTYSSPSKACCGHEEVVAMII